MKVGHDSGRILVVEDDRSIALGLRMNLEAEGYDVALAEDGAAGLARARAEKFDLVILDVMLPKMNGLEVVRALRADATSAQILMLSARSAEMDKVMGLELGADDYVTKPFGLAELLARVRVALRRRDRRPGEMIAFGDVVVDRSTREVKRSGALVDLTATEFDMMFALIDAKGAVLSRDQIFEKVWGSNHHGTPRTIDNFVAQLRSKLERDPAEPRHFVTVRGVGYRFVP